jgi:glycosyltransferase involved in cell wall biosynthesis
MRIAIVCATYHRGKSYQENVWAEQLAKSGHMVRVFAAGDSDGPIETIAETNGSYQIQTAATWNLPRSTFWSRSVHHLVRDFVPQLIVICGDKTFVGPIVHEVQLAHVPLISTFSENLSMHEFDWRKRGISLKQRAMALGFVATRGGPIRAVCRRSTLVVGNTPQAREILSRLFSPQEWGTIREKMIDMPLGFSPEQFRYDPQVRVRVRSELGFRDSDVVVCTSSHFTPVKEPGLVQLIEALRDAMSRHAALKAMIVGFSDDPQHAAVTQRINRAIERTGFADRFIKQPFASRQRLFELYNAADIAYFGRASISCQEALGTGLAVCVVDDGSLNHLVTMPQQGVFFRPGDQRDLADKLQRAVGNLEGLDVHRRADLRESLAEASAWLGYDRIIKSILDEVNRRTNLPRTADALGAV